MSTYITALVAGEYHVVRDVHRGQFDDIPLGLFCRQSLVEHLDADDIFGITKQGFGFFEGAFEMAYPFGKYDQLFVPEYNMGAMENAGAVTFRDELLFRSRQTVAAYEQRANTILHEMAHMWFGDLVTMRWWDDLWLNESFAEFAAHHSSVEATRFTDAWTGFTNNRKNWAYRQDQLPSTHPIAADNYDLRAVEANFDGITYAKGASALKQLVAWVGEKDFFAGLRAYFTKYAYSNTELTDLLAELAEASGRELDDWSQEWLQTSGVNTLQARFETDDEGIFTSFSVEQTAIEAFPTLRRHRIAIGLYNQVEGRLVRTERIETDVRGASTPIPELLDHRQPDLVLLNDDDLTYAKIRLDERSFATLLESIATFDESLPRALCWGSAWDMTRDAELPSADFVALVLAGVGSETDLTAVGSLLRQGQSAVNLFTSDAARPELAERWESGLRALVEDAEPGSDHQLALVRAYATAASGPGHVREILDGALDGLSVDTDLRWTLVSALARLGDADEDEIAAELERDNTISGQESAAAARAIRPTAEAKAEAWQRAAVDPDTPNETRRQIALAFQVVGSGRRARAVRRPLPRDGRDDHRRHGRLDRPGRARSTCSRWPTRRRPRSTRSTRGWRRRPPMRPRPATCRRAATTSRGPYAPRRCPRRTSSCTRSGRRPASRPRSTSMKTTFGGVLDLVRRLDEGDAEPLLAVLAVDRRPVVPATPRPSRRGRRPSRRPRWTRRRLPWPSSPTPGCRAEAILSSSSTATMSASVFGAFHWIGA